MAQVKKFQKYLQRIFLKVYTVRHHSISVCSYIEENLNAKAVKHHLTYGAVQDSHVTSEPDRRGVRAFISLH